MRPRYSGGVADGPAERAEYDDEGDEGEETTDEEGRLGGVEVRAEVRVPGQGFVASRMQIGRRRERQRGTERDRERQRGTESDRE